MFQREILSSHRLVEFGTEKQESLRETGSDIHNFRNKNTAKFYRRGTLIAGTSNVTRSLMVEDFFFLLPPLQIVL